MPFHLIKQHDIKDCGAACVSMICRYYGLLLPMAKFRELIKVDNSGANIYGIVDGAEKLGLNATALQGNSAEFLDSINKGEVKFPLIARIVADKFLEHYIVVYKISSKYLYVADPAKGKKKYTYKDFFEIWTGHIIIFEKTKAFQKRNECKGSLLRFLKLVTCQKKLLCATFFTSLTITIIGVLGAFIFQIIMKGIEVGGGNGFYGHSLAEICAAVTGLYFFQACVEALRGCLLARLSKKVDIPLMLGYYNHLTDLPAREFDSRKTGEFMSRFADASSVRDAVSGATLSLMLDTIMVAVCICLLLSINRNLFLVTIITILLYAFVVICFLKPIKNTNEKAMEKNAEVTSYFKESIDGIETIKAFGAENNVKSKTASKYSEFINFLVRGSVIYSFQNAISGLIASVGAVALLWIGTEMVIKGKLSFGILLTFYSLLGYFLAPVQRLIDLQPQLQTAVVAAERLNDIFDLKIEKISENNAVINNSIDIKNVDFRYGNRELVLKNINLGVKSGEKIALVGESGSGKTTLAKLIMAFYPPEKGEILIGNTDISALTPNCVRENIAYVSQNIFLFSDTIKNNLTFENENISMKEVKNVCHMCKADEFIEKLPLGYDTFIGENGCDLSGGQKQRLAIARAMLKKPKIIIMDEATSNLDTITENSIKETINSVCKDITCIIIAHRLSTIKNCDRIYVMKNGKIIEEGSHAQLLEMNGVYKRFCDENV